MVSSGEWWWDVGVHNRRRVTYSSGAAVFYEYYWSGYSSRIVVRDNIEWKFLVEKKEKRKYYC